MSTRTKVWAGGAVLVCLQLAYMLLWWNRGIQLNSNGLPTLAAHDILAGKMPYLDFYFWCPPGHLLIYTALAAVFGDGLIYIRAFAVVERVATYAMVYFWLTRVVSPGAAFFGTFAAAIGFCADPADVISHYDFDAVFTSVAAGWAASVAMSSRDKYARVLFLVTGFLAGCCMLCKQTQGVGMFLIFPVIFFLGDTSRAVVFRLRTILEYLVGWAIPTGLAAAWLIQAGAWHAFIDQNFVKGTSSKGSLSSILLRPLYLPFVVKALAVALAAAVLLMATYGWLVWKEKRGAVQNDVERGLPWALWISSFAAVFAGFAAAWWLPHPESYYLAARWMVTYTTMCIFISLFGSVALALWYTRAALFGMFRGDGHRRAVQIWILASVSATTAYMFSLSWAAYEKMLIPGFAFLAALALNAGLRYGFKRRDYAVVALGLALISVTTFRKLIQPYDWENWVDGPIRSMTEVSDFPEMRGLRVGAKSAAFLEHVTHEIDAHSRPDETIFCYPNYALFYVLAHRQPGVFAYMHWFDIVSDAMVAEDAARIREHPPAVIVSVMMPESMIHNSEVRFRNGNPSGQRKMLDIIATLPGYRLIDSVPIPYQSYPLNIYARE